MTPCDTAVRHAANTRTAPAQTNQVSKETYYRGKRDLLMTDTWIMASMMKIVMGHMKKRQ